VFAKLLTKDAYSIRVFLRREIACSFLDGYKVIITQEQVAHFREKTQAMYTSKTQKPLNDVFYLKTRMRLDMCLEKTLGICSTKPLRESDDGVSVDIDKLNKYSNPSSETSMNDDLSDPKVNCDSQQQEALATSFAKLC
jgi:hypothetical protein